MTAPSKPTQKLGDITDKHPETLTPNPSLYDGDEDDKLNKTLSSSPPPVENGRRSLAESEELFDFDHDVPSDEASDISSPHPNDADGESSVSGPNDVPPTKKPLAEFKLITNLKVPQTKTAFVSLLQLP